MAKNAYINFTMGEFLSERDEASISVINIDGAQVAFVVEYPKEIKKQKAKENPDEMPIYDNNHSHSSFEIQYIIENDAEIFVANERKVKLSEGDLLLLPPNMLHKTIPHPQRFERNCINFSIITDEPELDDNTTTNLGNRDFYNELFSKINREITFRNTEIQHCIKKIYELGNNSTHATVTSQMYLSLIFLEIVNIITDIVDVNAKRSITNYTQPAAINDMRKWIIDAYVAAYYMDKNHVENLSKILKISPRHTSRIVKELKGASLQDIILAQRMDVATEMLKTTNLPLKEIATMVGYETYAGFYLAFTKYFDYAPERINRENN